ncbi:cyclic nucleotide-binding domain-containing protein 2-like isoform X2 [Hemicordylus capensis]|nr:cyclic nucleotide-binding domain-containing protein 2-like isoform X2 [Hemicordylus capensis]
MLLRSIIRQMIRITEKAQNTQIWGDTSFCTGHRHLSSKPKEKEGLVQQSNGLVDAFDKTNFKCPTEFTFPERATTIVLQRPEERSAEDVLFLRHVMRGMLSFRHYSNSMQLMLAKVVRYERFGKSRVVVRKGQRGNSFYFVFSGTISVTQDEDGSSALLDQEPILLKKGASFGEIALLKGLRRNATVVCMEETELLVVDKKDFLSNKLDLELQKEFEYRFQFFRSLDLLSSLSDESLMTLAGHCKTEQYHHSQVVVSDTSKTKNIIFIVKGRCNVLRLLDLSQCPTYLKWSKQQKVLPGRKVFRNISQDGSTFLAFHHSPPDVSNPEIIQRNASDRFCSAKEIQEMQIIVSGTKESREEKSIMKNKMFSCSSEEPIIRKQCQTGTLSHSCALFCIDSLRPGQYFKGVDMNYIETHLKKEDNACQDQKCLQPLSLRPVTDPAPQEDRPMVICSQGSEIIRIKLNMFCELANFSTLHRMKKEIQPYPSDDELCRIFLKENSWKQFKENLVSNIKQTKGALQKLDPRRPPLPRSCYRSCQWDLNYRRVLHGTSVDRGSTKM